MKVKIAIVKLYGNKILIECWVDCKKCSEYSKCSECFEGFVLEGFKCIC